MRPFRACVLGWLLGILFALAPPAAAGTVTDIANNAVVTGTILVADDVDEYRFDVTAASGLGINLKTDPGVYVDVGLSLYAPSGAEVSLLGAKRYRDKFRQIVVSGLKVTETGTYRLLVTAAAPCPYTLKLSTTPCPSYTSTVLLAPGGESTVNFSAPRHAQLRLEVRTRGRSRAQPRFGTLNELDLSATGLTRRNRHQVRITDSGDARYFALTVRDLGGRGGRVAVQVQVRAAKEPTEDVDTSDQTEILGAVPGNGRIDLTWLPTLDATTYTIYWSNEPGVRRGQGNVNVIEGVTGTTYAHLGLTNGLAYYYAISATCEQHRERECSRECWAVLPPDPPAGITASPGDGLVQLGWSAAIGAESYRIYWSTLPGVNPQNGTLIDGIEDTAYTHTGLVNGETYHYVLTTVGAGGESPPSPVVTVSLRPEAPDTVSAGAGDGWVQITWSDSYGATSYNVYRATEPGVTQETGQLFAGVTSPWNDNTVTNGTMYFYVVTAVGLGGESDDSLQVAARPVPTPEAPLNVTATVTEEAANSLTITWDPPVIGADSYTIYWDTQPGVTIGTNPIPNVTSPFVHSGLAGQTAYYYIVTSTLMGNESEASVEVSATPRGSATGGGDTGYGNNLSFPVVFADGYGIMGARLGTNTVPYLDLATGMRPTADDVVSPFPYFAAADAVVRNQITYYVQQSVSTWQAEWRDGSGTLQEVTADWADALRSKTFNTSSVVRIETILYQDTTDSAPTDTMTAYDMAIVSGAQVTEMQGTPGTTYGSNVRTVYSVHPRLRIEKLQGRGGAVDDSVTPIDLATVDRFTTDGTGTYGAELNVAGKLIYGYVWQLRTMPIAEGDKVGWWRISFLLDPQVTVGEETVDRNTKIVGLDASDQGSAAAVADDGWSTWIEIQITQ